MQAIKERFKMKSIQGCFSVAYTLWNGSLQMWNTSHHAKNIYFFKDAANVPFCNITAPMYKLRKIS